MKKILTFALLLILSITTIRFIIIINDPQYDLDMPEKNESVEGYDSYFDYYKYRYEKANYLSTAGFLEILSSFDTNGFLTVTVLREFSDVVQELREFSSPFDDGYDIGDIIKSIVNIGKVIFDFFVVLCKAVLYVVADIIDILLACMRLVYNLIGYAF